MTRVQCNYCRRVADAVHLIPGVNCRGGVKLACAHHDPGGYWFYIDRWATGPNDWKRPGRLYTMRQHLLTTKVHGREAVSLIEEHLPTELVELGRTR